VVHFFAEERDGYFVLSVSFTRTQQCPLAPVCRKLDSRWRLQGRTPQGQNPDGDTITECLVPKWEFGELTPEQPCARQPCLHRVVADCPPETAAILHLAGGYGLLAASIAN